MSSLEIRDAARGMAGDPSWPAGVPFVESENESTEPEDLPALFCTLQFDPSPTTESLEVGPRPKLWKESGSIWVYVLTASGVGDDAGIAAANLAKTAILAWAGWPAKFHLEVVSPPGTPEPAADGSWFQVDIEIEYRWQYVS